MTAPETSEWLESPSVVIKPVDAAAVYANRQGGIVIRQKSSKGIFLEKHKDSNLKRR